MSTNLVGPLQVYLLQSSTAHEAADADGVNVLQVDALQLCAVLEVFRADILDSFAQHDFLQVGEVAEGRNAELI